jgi:hypothetical protein
MRGVPHIRKAADERLWLDGHRYASLPEVGRALQLKSLCRCDQLDHVIPHPTYRLGPVHRYTADFEVWTTPTSCYVEEIKGTYIFRDSEKMARLKRHIRFWRVYGHCPMRVLIHVAGTDPPQWIRPDELEVFPDTSLLRCEKCEQPIAKKTKRRKR